MGGGAKSSGEEEKNFIVVPLLLSHVPAMMIITNTAMAEAMMVIVQKEGGENELKTAPRIACVREKPPDPKEGKMSSSSSAVETKRSLSLRRRRRHISIPHCARRDGRKNRKLDCCPFRAFLFRRVGRRERQTKCSYRIEEGGDATKSIDWKASYFPLNGSPSTSARRPCCN